MNWKRVLLETALVLLFIAVVSIMQAQYALLYLVGLALLH